MSTLRGKGQLNKNTTHPTHPHTPLNDIERRETLPKNHLYFQYSNCVNKKTYIRLYTCPKELQVLREQNETFPFKAT